MKQILAATALAMAFTVGAFAQTDGKNTSARADLDAAAGGDTTVFDMMMDSEGMDVDDTTFQANWDAATPEQRTALKDACTEAEKAKVQLNEMAWGRCKMAMEN